MILKELFYINHDNGETEESPLYNPKYDTSVVYQDDTRKTRLSLKQINELRRASEEHIREQELELDFIARMYSTQAAEGM